MSPCLKALMRRTTAVLTSRHLLTNVAGSSSDSHHLRELEGCCWALFCCIFRSRFWFRTSLKDIFIGVLLIMET